MERFIIHRIQIGTRDQRVLFQIRIPRTTKRVIGIKVTTDLEVDDYELQHAGSLRLSLPVVREAFYAEVLKANTPMHDWSGYAGLMPPNFTDGQYWTGGAKESYLSINVPPYQTIIEGYYTNEFRLTIGYTVSIYLRLEV